MASREITVKVENLETRVLAAEAERDAMRRVVQAALAWRDARPGAWTNGADVEFHLFTAVDTYRASIETKEGT